MEASQEAEDPLVPVEPTAGPGGAHPWIKLTMEVYSRALRAEVGQGLAP